MPDFSSYLEPVIKLWAEGQDIWSKGGWAMWPIAIIAMAMFGMGIHIYLGLRATGFARVREQRWREWIKAPETGTGPVGELVRLIAGHRSLKESDAMFKQIFQAETRPFQRDLKVMKICVSAAPLVGLLGTVTGMLSTFEALASSSGGDKTMSMVASGISEALITTETGLVVALPGLFMQFQLMRGFERYKAFLAQLETASNQHLHRKILDQNAAARLDQAELANRLQKVVGA